MAFTDTAPETHKDESDAIGAAAREQLKAFVARIERLEEGQCHGRHEGGLCRGQIVRL